MLHAPPPEEHRLLQRGRRDPRASSRTRGASPYPYTSSARLTNPCTRTRTRTRTSQDPRRESQRRDTRVRHRDRGRSRDRERIGPGASRPNDRRADVYIVITIDADAPLEGLPVELGDASGVGTERLEGILEEALDAVREPAGARRRAGGQRYGT